MKIIAIWRDNTDYAREVGEWIDEMNRSTGREIESIDPDTVMGEIFCSSHDIVQYPTICVIDESSKILRKWVGKLPQFEEVSHIMRNV